MDIKTEKKSGAEDHTKTIQMLEFAQEVVSAYGKILEKCSKMGSLYPQSELPFSKDIIKNSIILLVTYYISRKKEDVSYFNSLKIGYGMLANFVSDGVSSRDAKFNSSIKNMSRIIERWDAVSEAINNEFVNIDFPDLENERSIIESASLMDEFDQKVKLIRQSICGAV